MKGRRQKDYRPAKRGVEEETAGARTHKCGRLDPTLGAIHHKSSPSVQHITAVRPGHLSISLDSLRGAISIINKLISLSCSHLETESGSLIISEEKVVLDWLADFIPGMKT